MLTSIYFVACERDLMRTFGKSLDSVYSLNILDVILPKRAVTLWIFSRLAEF
jgi:hypothetical protein